MPGFLSLLVATVVLLAGAVRMGNRLMPASGGASLLCAALLLPVQVVVLTMVVGGLLHAYEPTPMLVGALVLGAVTWLLAGRIRADVGPHLELGDTTPQPRSIVVLSWCFVALAAVALAWRALIALVLPPNAYDALAYHLPTIAEWVRNGEVGTTPLMRDLCCGWYPASGEAWAGWSAVFLHSDRLVGLAQVWTAVLLGLGVMVLARTWGAPRAHARLAGSLAVTMPIVVAQADTAYVDVTYAAAIVAALAFLAVAARAAQHLVLRASVMCGISIGFAMGVKGTGLVEGLLCAVALVVVLVVRFRRRALAPIGVATAAALALALPWYVHAWVGAGNPIEPYELRVAGLTLFEGTLSHRELNEAPEQVADLPAVLQPLRSWAEDLRFVSGGFRYGADVRAGGFGPLFLLGALPALAWLLVARAWRGRDLAVAAVLAVAFLALVLQPYGWWTRFTIPVGAVGMAAVGCALAALRPRVATVVAAVALLAALAPLTKVGIGNSDVVANYGRTQVFSSAPDWLRDRPTSIEAMSPRFDWLSELDERPVVIDRGLNNRAPYLAIGHSFSREVRYRSVEPAPPSTQVFGANADAKVSPAAG